jgi:2,3-bisphosphoglycerate-independent phosphoglycerate mutase
LGTLDDEGGGTILKLGESPPRTLLLCILDGFGLNPRSDGNAVALAKKPTFDRLWQRVPSTTLITYGERVGLPEGQMGNSEVGHLNIGAGRVIEQWLPRISRALTGSGVTELPAYQNFLRATRASKAIHLIGLFSVGGVHSHSDHLRALITRLKADTNAELIVHVITDGRDTGPQLAGAAVAAFEAEVAHDPRVKIGSVVGRFFAMDRDKRWERTERAYSLFQQGKGALTASASAWIEASYNLGVTDEFIEPATVHYQGAAEGDGWVFWNFREDRMRQIVRSLCVSPFSEIQRSAPPPTADQVLGFTEYDHNFHLPYLFSQLEVRNHLGAVVASNGFRQLRVAETEKYAHVTYFLNGGDEVPAEGEERRMIPSPRDVKTYDQKPEMSAEGVTAEVIEGIRSGSYKLIVVNFANCDMVGHTGVLGAAIAAVEKVDECLGRVLDELQAFGGQAIIIADHGNAEQMINYEDGTPHTAHTTFPVPMMVVGAPGVAGLRAGGALCDVAPTALALLGIPQPPEMSGSSLLPF